MTTGEAEVFVTAKLTTAFLTGAGHDLLVQRVKRKLRTGMGGKAHAIRRGAKPSVSWRRG